MRILNTLPEGAEALSPGRVGQNLRNFGGAKLRITETSVKSPLEKVENRIFFVFAT